MACNRGVAKRLDKACFSSFKTRDKQKDYGDKHQPKEKAMSEKELYRQRLQEQLNEWKSAKNSNRLTLVMENQDEKRKTNGTGIRMESSSAPAGGNRSADAAGTGAGGGLDCAGHRFVSQLRRGRLLFKLEMIVAGDRIEVLILIIADDCNVRKLNHGQLGSQPLRIGNKLIVRKKETDHAEKG